MEIINQYMTVIIAAAAVVLLVIVGLMIARHMSRRTRVGQGTRLGINEYHVVDEQRRLVLVRRDSVEHLLLIGGGQDVVVESNIRNRYDQPESDEEVSVPTRISPTSPPIPLRPPRAPVFADRRPQLRTVDPPIGGPRNFEQDT